MLLTRYRTTGEVLHLASPGQILSECRRDSNIHSPKGLHSTSQGLRPKGMRSSHFRESLAVGYPRG